MALPPTLSGGLPLSASWFSLVLVYRQAPCQQSDNWEVIENAELLGGLTRGSYGEWTKQVNQD